MKLVASLRGPGPAGTEEHWSFYAGPEVLLIKRGQIGKRAVRKIRVPLTKCLDQDPVKEARERRKELLAKGFWDETQPLVGPKGAVQPTSSLVQRALASHHAGELDDWF